MAELTMDNPLSPAKGALYGKTIADLKECIYKLKEDFEDGKIPINDDNQDLQRFCAKMEYLLQAHLKPKSSLLGGKKDYWNYICDCLSSNKSLSDCIKYVKSKSDIKTNLGRGRACIRFTLMHQRLADTIQQCTTNGKCTSDWYNLKSVWLQQELSSEVINMLYDLNDIQFDLASDGYDLDTAWPSFARKQFSNLGSWNIPSAMGSRSSLSSNDPGFGTSPYPLDDTIIRQKQQAALAQVDEYENEKLAAEAELESVKDKVAKLEQALEETKKKYSSAQVQVEKLTCELQLKSDNWIEKEDFLKMKIDELEKYKVDLETQLQTTTKEANTALEKALASTESKFQENNALDTLVAQVKSIAEEKATLQTHFEHLEAQCEELKTNLQTKEDNLHETDKKLQNAESKREEIQKTLQAKEIGFKNLQKSLHSKDSDISDLQITSKSKDAEISELKETASALEATVLKLEADVRSEDSTINNKMEELNGKNNDIVQLEHALEEKSSQIEKQRTEIELRKSDIERLKCDITQKSVDMADGHDIKIRELETLKSELTNKNIEISSMKSDLVNKDSKLEKFISEVSSKDKELDSLIKERDSLKLQCQNEIHKLSEQNVSLENQVQSSKRTVENLGKETMDLKEKNEDLTKDNAVKREDIRRLNMEVISLSEQAEYARQEGESEKGQKVALQNDLEVLKFAKADISNRLQITTESSKTETAALNAVIKTLEKEVETRVTESNEYKTRISVLENEKRSVGDDFVKVKESKKKMAAKIENLEDQLDKLRIEYSAQTRKIGELSSQLESANEVNRAISSSKEELEEKYAQLETNLQEHNTLQDELLKQSDSINNTLQQKEQDFCKLQQQCEERGNVIKSQESHIAELKSLLETQERMASENLTEISTLKQKINDTELEKEQTCENMNASYFELKEKLGQSNCEAEALAEELKKITSEKESLHVEWKNENVVLSEQVQQLNSDLESKTVICCDWEAKVEELKGESEKKNEEIGELKTELDTITKKEEELKLKIDELDGTVQKKNEEVDVLKRKLEIHTKKEDDLESKIQELNIDIEKKNEDIDTLKTTLENSTKRDDEDDARYAESQTELVKLKNLVDQLTTSQAEFQQERETEVSTIREEKAILKSDNLHLKSKIVKLTKEKDTLWHKTDELSYKNKMIKQGVWMESKDVTNCMGCNTQFSFINRKHHCRLCGRIFCHACCANFVQTTGSSKKERCCLECLHEQNNLEVASEGSSSEEEDLEKYEHPVTKRVTDTVLPESDEEEDSAPSLAKEESFISTHSTTEVSASANQDVENREGATAGDTSGEPSDDAYDVITTEEVVQSQDLPLPDPNMSSSVLLTEEDLTGEATGEPELWIKPGKFYTVPVSIDAPGSVLSWHFTTYPKDIHFSLSYKENEWCADDTSEELIPLCKCNSHKAPVEGELEAIKPGLYTLVFDNTASRFTSKKLDYKLNLKAQNE